MCAAKVGYSITYPPLPIRSSPRHDVSSRFVAGIAFSQSHCFDLQEILETMGAFKYTARTDAIPPIPRLNTEPVRWWRWTSVFRSFGPFRFLLLLGID